MVELMQDGHPDPYHPHQPAMPYMKAVEQGRNFSPEYGGSLSTTSIDPTQWNHICSCRFGPGRPCGLNCTTKWNGDSYRYDIFERDPAVFGHVHVALRWWNGGGEGWLIDTQQRAHRGVSPSLLYTIAAMPSEEARWDACHFLWEVAEKTRHVGINVGRSEYANYFAMGRLKKRKRNGVVSVEVAPEVQKASNS